MTNQIKGEEEISLYDFSPAGLKLLSNGWEQFP